MKRRDFLKNVATGATTLSYFPTRLNAIHQNRHGEKAKTSGGTQVSAGKEQPPAGSLSLEADRFYHGYALAPGKPGSFEALLVRGVAGQIYLVYSDFSRREQLMMKASSDGGRSWGEPSGMRDRSGNPVRGFHVTVLRLKSGQLGMVYSASDFPGGHPGRDGGRGMMFRRSEDEGHTWSDPAVVYPFFALCTSGHAVVLSGGRILAPAYKWLSHDPTGNAEQFTAANAAYSFTCVSDDEGQTWRPGLSELFVSVRRAAYNLEEPIVVELKDGRVLMHLRNQLGRMYRSFSENGGLSWSRPEPLHIASAYTPTMLRRMPTGDLLMIWNQSSRQEILRGLHRHRLSCAVSKDEGQTWGHFRNLESLDDTTVVSPPPPDQMEVLEQWEDYGYYQPVNLKRYHRVPGVLRICYPDVICIGDEAVIVYDYGEGTLKDAGSATKLRIIPLKWFTS